MAMTPHTPGGDLHWQSGLAISSPDGAIQKSQSPGTEKGQEPPPVAIGNDREVWNCRRKLRHVDFLSALKHASGLGEQDIHIYRCQVCDGLHIGHDPSSERLKVHKKLRKKLNAIAKRLQVLELEKQQLEDRKRALIAQQASL
jgi:hypothetical protein